MPPLAADPASAAAGTIVRLTRTAERLIELWEERRDGVLLPGWGVPFRPLGELLPPVDAEFAEHNPQMMPLLWYPALRSGTVIDVFDHLPGGMLPAGPLPRRQELSRVYSWSIASRTALDWFAECLAGRGLLEVGAGSGYWASLLRARGVDVVATDAVTELNGYTDRFRYTEVAEATAVDAVRGHPERVLSLVWPPGGDPMAVEALRSYRGDALFYLGDRPGGLCADAAFGRELAQHWVPRSRCPLTLRWLGVGDRATFWVRRDHAHSPSAREGGGDQTGTGPEHGRTVPPGQSPLRLGGRRQHLRPGP